MKLTLRTKIIIPTLLLFIIATTLAVTYTQYATSIVLRKSMDQSLTSDMRGVGIGLDGAVNSIFQDIAGMGITPPLLALQNGKMPAEAVPGVVKELTDSLLTRPYYTDGTYVLACFIDKSGKVLVSTDPALVGKDALPVPDKSKGEVPVIAQDFFIKAMRGEKYVGPGLRIENRTVEGKPGGSTTTAVIPFSYAIGPGSAPLGVVLVHVNFQKLAMDYVKQVKIGTQGHAFVSGYGGEMLYHPYAPVLEEKGPSGLTPLFFKERRGYKEYTWDKADWIAIYDTDALTNWTVIVKARADEVFGDVTVIKWKSILSSLVSLAVVALFLWIIVTKVVRALRQTVHFAEEVAEGRLDHDFTTKSTDEVGTLADALRRMVVNLKAMLTAGERQTAEAKAQTERAEKAVLEAEESRTAAEKARNEGIHHAATQLEALVDQLKQQTVTLESYIEKAAQGADLQSRTADDNASAVSRMSATVQQVGSSASSAAAGAARTRDLAEGGTRAVADVGKSIQTVNTQAHNLKNGLNVLGNRAQGIGQIMNIISDIADQTNLLALNAAIEAARAGEAGRGFAVVADEVRKLAEKTMVATREVGASITAIQSGTTESIALMEETSKTVDQTTALAEQAEGALQEISAAIKVSTEHVGHITQAGQEQIDTNDLITRNTEAINSISTNTAQLMHEAKTNLFAVTKATEALYKLLHELKR